MTFKELARVTTNIIGSGYCVAGADELRRDELQMNFCDEAVVRHGVVSEDQFMEIALHTPVGDAEVGEVLVVENPAGYDDPIVLITVPDAVLGFLRGVIA